MFWEYMLKGFAHGGYVLGLLGTLIIAACLVTLFCLLMGMAFGQEEDDEALEGRKNHVRKNQQL